MSDFRGYMPDTTAASQVTQHIDIPKVASQEIQDLIVKKKDALEKEINTQFYTFRAKLYIRKDTEIVVRIDVGDGQYIDALFDDGQLMSYEDGKQLDDDMTTDI